MSATAEQVQEILPAEERAYMQARQWTEDEQFIYDRMQAAGCDEEDSAACVMVYRAQLAKEAAAALKLVPELVEEARK